MDGRLKLIEQQLLGIDSAAFQNLCDLYLSLRQQEFASINRTGSQLGKQKTVKGTPDTFFRLVDGSLNYVEYTTKAEGLVDKIKGDIDKCLDQNKTGVPADEVHKITIFFNSRLEVAEETAIIKHAASKSIRVELIGLDWLALEIYSKYLILAKDILGIPLDTGQLLPLQNFIDEYNNKAGKLSTPLDNIFLHRNNELANIESILSANNILIISGFPGVGKTKIALEALNKFLLSHEDYSAFAVSKKDQNISEDLIIHLQQVKNYVLMVDDANRQLVNFKQILGVFKEKRKGNIKLVITVRDYALNDVNNECFEFDPHKLVLKKFTDEEITSIINSDSFKIVNPRYQEKIVAVADGNARLAVMAARVANEQQESFLLGDVSDLYDSYFQTFIKDFDIFGDKNLLKTLGIISFFYTIDRSNKEFIETVLKNFEMDYYNFNEAIDELEKKELVEVRYNNARVSEQVMGTYFFYNVFIKNEILSFKTLLFAFYPVWKKRFSDTIIPSNNSFGYENVLNKISNILDEYLHSVYIEEDKVLEFFSLFYFYKREETLHYFHQKIKQLPEPENPYYNTKYERNDFVWDTDKTLDFISKFFNHFTESFLPALELAFEYCRKKPESLPELIKKIREKLLFDEGDENNHYQRQIHLFNLLIDRFKQKQPPIIQAFFALVGTFLSHYYQNTKGGRNDSYTFYQYALPFYDVTKDFRKTLWTTLFNNFEFYPTEVFSIIKNFRPGRKGAIPEILEFDLSLLLPFIENNLNQSNFEHIHFIHEFVAMLDSEDIKDRSYKNLKEKFSSKEYDYFKKLDWNSLRGKQNYDFKNHEGFEKLKERDIRTSFVFTSIDEFATLQNGIKNFINLDEINTQSAYQSLNIIVEENFLRNDEIGFQLLELLLKDYPTGVNSLHKAIEVIVSKSEAWAFRLWNLLMAWNHEYKLHWQFAFLELLPKEFINEFYCEELINTVNSINRQNYVLYFKGYEKFQIIDKDIFLKILKIAVNKNGKEDLKINLWYQFFERYSQQLSDNHSLLEKAYVQQETIINHHDANGAGLKHLVGINPKFFIEYISLFYANKENSVKGNKNKQLAFVWEFDNYIELLEAAINLIIENASYLGISEHRINMFFYHLNKESKEKAKQFIRSYITKYNTDRKKMDSIFDVLRHSMSDLFEEGFLHYIDLNPKIEDFENILWRGNGGVYSGDVIIGDMRAKDWQKIFEIVKKSNRQLDLIPITTFIKKRIEFELRRGEEERKMKFINPDGY